MHINILSNQTKSERTQIRTQIAFIFAERKRTLRLIALVMNIHDGEGHTLRKSKIRTGSTSVPFCPLQLKTDGQSFQ